MAWGYEELKKLLEKEEIGPKGKELADHVIKLIDKDKKFLRLLSSSKIDDGKFRVELYAEKILGGLEIPGTAPLILSGFLDINSSSAIGKHFRDAYKNKKSKELIEQFVKNADRPSAKYLRTTISGPRPFLDTFKELLLNDDNETLDILDQRFVDPELPDYIRCRAIAIESVLLDDEEAFNDKMKIIKERFDRALVLNKNALPHLVKGFLCHSTFLGTGWFHLSPYEDWKELISSTHWERDKYKRYAIKYGFKQKVLDGHTAEVRPHARGCGSYLGI